MTTLMRPTRRGLLKTAAIGAVGLAAPAILPRGALAQTKRITIADVGGAPAAAIKTAFCDPFQQETGIEVVNVAHDADPVSQFKMLVDTKTFLWDACMVTPDHVARLHEAGDYIETLGFAPESVDGMIPGTLTADWAGFSVYGIIMAYRNDKFGENGPKTWADFWDVEKYPGRRGLYRGASGMLELALLADGVAPQDLYPIDMDRAFAKLDQIKEHVSVWWASGAQNTQILQNGEVDMSDSWAGRTFAAIDAGAPVTPVWNGLYNVDGWSVVKGTPHLEEVREFCRFCLRPDRQGHYSSIVANGPTNNGAFEHMDPARAHRMPTFPDNIKNLTMLNSEWWTANNDKVVERMEEWLLL